MATEADRLDPSQSTTLREQFIRAMRRRFRAVQSAVRQLVADDDAFGLKPNPSPIVANAPYEFLTDAAKVEAFRAWLTERIDAKILEVDQRFAGRPWLSPFIDSAYRKGLVRAFTDVRPEAAAANLDFYRGTRAQFLTDAFAAPETVSKLELLATRSYESLKGVTDQMASRLNVLLADGIANGTGPIDVARQMTDVVAEFGRVRAERIARTEVIHAHAEGQLDSFDRLGVVEVGVLAEWKTAGDDRVCPLCSSMEGKVFTIAEARGQLPLHVNCRCAWLPSTDYEMQRRAALGRRRAARPT